MRKLLSLLALSSVYVLCFSTTAAFGQQGASAGVFGNVVDSQGAVIAGAKVSLLHVATNQTRTTATDAAGEFRFPLLPVGEYRVTVEQPGFKKFEQTGLRLQVNDTAKIGKSDYSNQSR